MPSIVTVSSLSGISPSPLLSVYAASKAAVRYLMKGIVHENAT